MHFSGRALRSCRLTAGMSAQSLANKMSVHRQTVYDWEWGSYTPHADTVGKLASVLKVPVGRLYERDTATVSMGA